MNAMRRLRRLTVLIVIAILTMLFMTAVVLSADNDEPKYLGKPFSYWLRVIRSRDEQLMSLAFDAVRGLGPQARAAVPDLMQVIAAPFTPIAVGKDSPRTVARKLYDIELRADAIDALAAIGESAASATDTLVRWALAPRVSPDAIKTSDDEEVFIELIMMDTEQRMRVAGAVAQLGPDASEVIAHLLTSPDTARRKLGVAILSEGALLIASGLLRSRRCEDRVLGLTIMRDMDLVVSKPHVDWLQSRIVCAAN